MLPTTTAIPESTPRGRPKRNQARPEKWPSWHIYRSRTCRPRAAAAHKIPSARPSQFVGRDPSSAGKPRHEKRRDDHFASERRLQSRIRKHSRTSQLALHHRPKPSTDEVQDRQAQHDARLGERRLRSTSDRFTHHPACIAQRRALTAAPITGASTAASAVPR